MEKETKVHFPELTPGSGLGKDVNTLTGFAYLTSVENYYRMCHVKSAARSEKPAENYHQTLRFPSLQRQLSAHGSGSGSAARNFMSWFTLATPINRVATAGSCFHQKKFW